MLPGAAGYGVRGLECQPQGIQVQGKNKKCYLSFPLTPGYIWLGCFTYLTYYTYYLSYSWVHLAWLFCLGALLACRGGALLGLR